MKTKEEIQEKLKEKEEKMRKDILEMSRTEVEIDTKYIIYFEDHGQDFLEWHINEDGYVLDSRPFQRSIWAGKFTIPETARVGEKLAIWLDRETYVNYPIKEIKVK